jgi:hypothetical protein
VGSLSSQGDAIGLSQGGVLEAGTNLRRQVQNFSAHGMVGFFKALQKARKMMELPLDRKMERQLL